ncbi:MAG: type VI secretion system membrane subunit TssM [Candidatus Thiodiazotropha sp. (ex Dulcina madagascariensis)]|nr:type VI secretion system membrane subunit TssM [Candidatus Thiodiazotropha sp. (ex Dulcina madagascariensis)]MCU7927980.1 type VI secretion system membrane subunit TssM [Candidatus Thiodiazotropha sp. (ex Dulcina madagascariensis)]
MQAILRIIKNRWFVAVLGLIAISVIIWLVGPLIAIAGVEPLGSAAARLIAIGVVILLWGANQLRRYLASRKKNQQMLESVVGQKSNAGEARSRESEEEVQILGRRLDDAIRILKESKVGGKHNRQYLYQLPWYMFIGPPGSGKTTALLNSGLHFPLADKLGNDAVQGIGGTRNCDWWFTDDAVLLDTAGRYTTQDSYEEVDRAAWMGFLDLLKKHRKRRPINGALVAISVEDILQQTELERINHAKAIRMRVKELIDHFGIRFPIYVLFTKCDLLAGFNEFFENMGREERSQVWGMTFPLTDKDDQDTGIGHFQNEFRALEKRIDARLLDRLEQERDAKRRVLIYSFPQQFSALREAAESFLHEAFNANRFQETPMVRGIYFTSGTQEGTPIDRLLGSMAQEFGLNRQIAPAFSGTGRSFFINRLFKDLVFAESHLAGVNTRVERQRAWLQRLSYAGAISLAVLAGIAWFTSYSRNQSYVDLVAVQANAADEKVNAVAPDDLTLTNVVPALDSVRQIPGGYADREAEIPWLMGLGLYQGDKLGSEAISAYHNSLKNLFLPRIILSLEDQLTQPGNNPDYLYEALKVYLMFEDKEHYDAETVKAWLLLQWQLNLPGAENAQARQALASHLDALLEKMPMTSTLPLDQTLVGRVRNDLLRVPLADRVYNRMKRTTQGGSIPPVRLTQVIGADAELVFSRRSGDPLDKEIPALFTYEGYHKLFLKDHLAIANQLLEEKWILGPDLEKIIGKTDLVRLSGRVKDLYYDEYIRIWEQLLADVRVKPFSNMRQAVEILNILSGPTSPLRRYLTLVQEQTSLSRLPVLPGGAKKAAELVERNTSGITRRLASILQVAPDESSEPQDALLTTPVDQHFASLNRMIQTQEGEQAPLERTLEMLNELYAHMSSIASAGNQSNQAFNVARDPAGGSVISRLKLEAKRQPGPLAAMLNSLADGSSNLTVSGVRTHLNAVWNTQLLPFCQRSLAGRYPLDRSSVRETTISDFGRFFGPGGMMDNFFNTYLQDFVDTSRRVWRWNAAGNRALGIPTGTLRQFQRAAVIRDAFFSAGSQDPKINFEIKPLSMDTTITQITLLLNQQRVSYNHGPARWNRLIWPDDSGVSDTKILLAPPAGNKPSGLTEDGPWGWFRIIDQAKSTPTDSPETIKVEFDVGGRKSRFALRASGALNPFKLRELADFRCPNKL